jgi:hypothetical protein
VLSTKNAIVHATRAGLSRLDQARPHVAKRACEFKRSVFDSIHRHRGSGLLPSQKGCFVFADNIK